MGLWNSIKKLFPVSSESSEDEEEEKSPVIKNLRSNILVTQLIKNVQEGKLNELKSAIDELKKTAEPQEVNEILNAALEEAQTQKKQNMINIIKDKKKHPLEYEDVLKLTELLKNDQNLKQRLKMYGYKDSFAKSLGFSYENALTYLDLSAALALIGKGADCTKWKDSLQNTILHIAARDGNIDVMNKLGKEKIAALIEMKNELGDTPLYTAVKNKEYNFAKELLQHVAWKNNNIASEIKEFLTTATAADQAVVAKNLAKQNLKNFLLKKKIKSVKNDFWSTIKDKLTEEKTKKKEKFTQRAFFEGLNEEDKKRVTNAHNTVSDAIRKTGELDEAIKCLVELWGILAPLGSFLLQGYPTLITHAVNKGTANSVKDLAASTFAAAIPIDNTNLQLAIQRGDVEIVKALLPFNVDINAKNEDGNTPLHEVVLHCKGENAKALAELLIEHGADPEIDNKKMLTPLKLAKEQEKLQTQNKQPQVSKVEFNNKPILDFLQKKENEKKAAEQKKQPPTAPPPKKPQPQPSLRKPTTQQKPQKT